MMSFSLLKRTLLVLNLYSVISCQTCFAQSKEKPDGFSLHYGYYIDLKGDTIQTICRDKAAFYTWVYFKLDENDPNSMTEFTPQMIKGFGCRDKHYISVGFDSDRSRIYESFDTSMNLFPVFAEVYFRGEYYSLMTIHFEINPQAINAAVVGGVVGGIVGGIIGSAVGGRNSQAFFASLNRSYQSEVSGLRRFLIQEAQIDSLALRKARSKAYPTKKDAAEVLDRLEVVIRENNETEKSNYTTEGTESMHKRKIFIYKSEYIEMETGDGLILCKRTTPEEIKSLINFDKQLYAHVNYIEKSLEKARSLYLKDSLTTDFLAYIPRINSSIYYLKVEFEDFSFRYYENELLYYQALLEGTKEE